MIHPQAIIDPRARLGRDVHVGAFSIIGADVEIGDGTWIGPHVVINGPTRIGGAFYQFMRDTGTGSTLVGLWEPIAYDWSIPLP